MSFGEIMKEKTDLKNKTGDSKPAENNDIIPLIEEGKKPNNSEEINKPKTEKSVILNDDDEIIILKDVIQVSAEENEDFIELTDEVSPNPKEESAKINSSPTIIPTEIIDNAIERVMRKMFAEKIELMIREAIQKVIEEDIEKLQKQILNQQEKKA
jgi:hypothetical protein